MLVLLNVVIIRIIHVHNRSSRWTAGHLRPGVRRALGCSADVSSWVGTIVVLLNWRTQKGFSLAAILSSMPSPGASIVFFLQKGTGLSNQPKHWRSKQRHPPPFSMKVN